MLISQRKSLLGKACFNYGRLFHPVHCIACNICQCISAFSIFLHRATSILSIPRQFLHLCGTNCFGRGSRQKRACLYRFWSLHILFSNFISVQFKQDNSSFETIFPMCGNCSVSTTVSVSFARKFFGVVSTTRWSPILILIWERYFH